MAFDTKYRPRTYKEVLGQSSTVSILKRYVSEGRGFHQSYVFSGQHGSGKTTLARIMARALLCASPVEGEACDTCESCVSILSGDGHECLEELDAATKSGKDDLSRIIEDSNYSTFSGTQRVYIIDESHRLSKSALDVLLKPMEDNVPGSENKRLVILFCTTEPDKMVSTIFSRCAPGFVIRPASMEDITGRLAEVCHGEGIKYDREALLSLAEISKSHIRDALKSLEGVSLANGGMVYRESVNNYFKFDTNDAILELLNSILEEDKASALVKSAEVCQTLGPKTSYERLAEVAMLVYGHSLGVKSKRNAWDNYRIAQMSLNYGKESLEVAKYFSCPPGRPSVSSFSMDCVGFKSETIIVRATPDSEVTPEPSEKPKIRKEKYKSTPFVNSGGVYIDPRAVRGSSTQSDGYNGVNSAVVPNEHHLDRETFKKLVEVHMGGKTLECLPKKDHG